MSVEKVHRRRADESGDKDVRGGIVNVKRGIDLLNDAVFHNTNAVAHRHRLNLVVRHIDHCGFKAGVQLGDFGAHLHAHFGIEIGERFVEQKHFRLPDDCASHGDTLALSSGKSFRASLEIIVNAENLGGFVHPFVDVGFREFAEFQAECEIVVYGHVRIERVILENHCDIAVFRRNVVDDTVSDGNGSGTDLLQSGDHPERCGFSTAGGPDQHHEFPVPDFKIDMFDSENSAVIHFADIL